MKTKKLLNSFVVLSVLFGLVMANTALANDNGQNNSQNKPEKVNNNGGFLGGLWNGFLNRTKASGNSNAERANIISGMVSSVSGNTITVSVVERKLLNVPANRYFGTSTRQEYGSSTKPMFGTSTRPEFNKNMKPEISTSTVLYSVDATNAKIYEGRATTTVSNIAVGDVIWVQGKVTDQNVAAKVILVMAKNPIPKKGNEGKNNQFIGDGQPIVAGTISSISASSLTITNSGNNTYTVDITSAKIFEGNKTASSSDLAVGDAVVVQGTVNGTSITASSVIGQNAKAEKGESMGFFGSIGSFFSRLFKF